MMIRINLEDFRLFMEKMLKDNIKNNRKDLLSL